MAIKLMSREWVPFTHDYRCEYICDTDADFESLPASSVGSSAISLESGKVYVVSTFGNWIPFGEGYVEKEPVDILGTWKLNTTVSACPFGSISPARIDFTTDVSLVFTISTENGETLEKEVNSFNGMYCPYATVLYFVFDEGGLGASVIAFSGYENGFDGIIHITGGDDIENEAFVTWLTENATKVG